MESEPLTRKLAAILHADVVGYSRMMGEDESGTLARLKAHRKEFIDPTIASHHGRMVKLMGDGALIEFASVVDALACAVEVQRGMTERNKDEPEDRRIEFRIGINLGDVIVEGDDIYGDGVNVRRGWRVWPSLVVFASLSRSTQRLVRNCPSTMSSWANNR